MERIEKVYNEIISDKNIIDLYSKIDVVGKNLWAYHGTTHVLSVVKRVKDILAFLNVDSEFIYKCLIAAYLHDVGCLEGKSGHSERSKQFCEEYLENFNLTEEEKQEIVFAVENHSNFVDGGLMLAVLVFADKLDIEKTRLGEDGYAIEGMRQLQGIENVAVEIGEKVVVKITCNSFFNKKEFEEFYFCRKVFDAIDYFANYLGKKSVVLINGKEWNF